MAKHIKEKDLEPEKFKATAFSFMVFGIALLLAGLSTFKEDYTIKFICWGGGVLFILLGLRLVVRLLRNKTSKKL